MLFFFEFVSFANGMRVTSVKQCIASLGLRTYTDSFARALIEMMHIGCAAHSQHICKGCQYNTHKNGFAFETEGGNYCEDCVFDLLQSGTMA